MDHIIKYVINNLNNFIEINEKKIFLLLNFFESLLYEYYADSMKIFQ